LYRQIDLREEAVDEGERALGEDPASSSAFIFIAQMFELKNRTRAAQRSYEDAYRLDPSNTVARSKSDSLRTLIPKM
jgi:Tfp pilus assembly protein PilF